MPYPVRLSLVIASVLFSLPLVAEEGSFERTLSVEGPVRLEVKTGSGSILVAAGASNEVRVRGRIRARSGRFGTSSAAEKVRWIEENPPIDQQANVIRVGTFVYPDEDRAEGVSISYEIAAPADTVLVAKSGSGSQTLSDLTGPVEATSGSGSLVIGSIGGDVRARAGSGSVRLEGVKGNLAVRTGSGSITARQVEGAIEASAGSGSIEIESIGRGDVSVETGSGGVDIRGARGALRAATGSGSIRAEGEMSGDWTIEASSGGVTVELPPEAAFELDARSRSGRIDSDHPVTVTGRISRKELRGAVRGGGPLLSIDTSSGSIVIR